MIAKLKNSGYLIVVILMGFFALLLVDPENVLDAGRKAVDLCLNIILPSLLPFFVISRLILNTGAIYTISRFFKPIMKPLFNLPGSAAFPLIAGWLSGYPAGAKYTVDLYDKGLLNQAEAQRILGFCNNSGPLFIVGAVGIGYFGSSKLGLILLLCHLLASITVGIGAGIISRKKEPPCKNMERISFYTQTAFNGQMITHAVIDSTKVLLQISGTIIFFAVVVQIMETAGIFTFVTAILSFGTGSQHFFSETIKVFLAGGMEITYGLYLLSQTACIPLICKVLLTAFLCGFGGFSVHTQVTGLCPPEFKLKKYLYAKLFHGMIATFYTGVFIMNQSIPVMNNATGTFYSSKLSFFLLIAYGIFLVFCMIYLFKHRQG